MRTPQFVAVLVMLSFLLSSPRVFAEEKPSADTGIWPEIKALYGQKLTDVLPVFNALYLEDIRAAKKSKQTADDRLLAKRLLKTTERTTGQPPLSALLCQQVFELGINDPKTYEIADAAIALLVKRTPAAYHGTWQIKRADLLEKRADAEVDPALKKQLATDLIAVLTKAGDAERAAKKVKQAKAYYTRALKAAAKNGLLQTAIKQKIDVIDKELKAAADALARKKAEMEARRKAKLAAKMKAERERKQKLFWENLLVKNNPSLALKSIDVIDDPDIKANLPLAAKPIAQLTKAQCITVASWYRSLAQKHADDSKRNALTSAWKYYQRFLNLHILDDPQKTAAQHALADVEKQLKAFGLEPHDLTANSLPTVRRLPKIRSKNVGITLVKIPAGKFTMGSPKTQLGHKSDETPHSVVLTKDYYISTTEITQEQYEQVMGENPSVVKGKKLPVTNVTWADAMRFCRKLSGIENYVFRLPSEAEWEFAARGGQPGLFANGARLFELAHYKTNSNNKIHDVRSKAPNAFGLYDVHGNVAEWCFDWYGPYPSSETKNPGGPFKGEYKVVRGGTYSSPAMLCRAAARLKLNRELSSKSIGFRIVIDPNISTQPMKGGSGTFFGIPID